MWQYEKKLQYPVKIRNTDPALAKQIIAQYGGPYFKRRQELLITILSEKTDSNITVQEITLAFLETNDKKAARPPALPTRPYCFFL